MKIVACLAVRMGSQRFPGKTMSLLSGKPLLSHLVARVRSAKEIDGFVVATSVNTEDDRIEEFCDLNGWQCFRGSQKDVLGRMSAALVDCEAELGVVVYGDNPLVDPVIIDEVVSKFTVEASYDWVGNNLITTFPPGMEVEVFRTDCLVEAARLAKKKEYREHGTLFLRKNPQKYRLLNVEAKGVRRRPDLCLGVDTQEDASVVEAVIEKFAYSLGFSLEDIVSFLDTQPELVEKTRNVHRRWRQYRSD